MFAATVYQQRRSTLLSSGLSGLILFVGNVDSPMNYHDNIYPFVQDSSFRYFFGLNEPGLAAVLDTDSGDITLFGKQATMADIIWTGPAPSLQDKAGQAGLTRSQPTAALAPLLHTAQSQGRAIHYLPPYRGETVLQLAELLSITPAQVHQGTSSGLVRAVVAQREIKAAEEIDQMEQALSVTHDMHVAAMQASRPGVMEYEVVGLMEGIMRRHDWQLAYPSIFTKHGEVLHNHHHHNQFATGDLVLNDTGAAAASGYASDITRTFPVGGLFSPRQQDLYNTVLTMQLSALDAIRPGVSYQSIHQLSAEIMVKNMTSMGFFRGNPEDIVQSGAYAIAFPHGLGHQIGLDVHDMENLGEDLVGYGEGFQRSPLFGLGYLRLAKTLLPGMTLTVEPGLYFIPALIDQWQAEKRYDGLICYDMFQQYRDFGGIRIEDNVLVTATGSQVLGKPIPKTVEDIATIMQAD